MDCQLMQYHLKVQKHPQLYSIKEFKLSALKESEMKVSE